ncbi:MAG: hypothetical protein WCF18_09335 [Chthoniobacteraceae bacterium]
METKTNLQRHSGPSLLLVLALALLGLQAGESIAQRGGSTGVVLQQMQKQLLPLRSAETKSSTRKVQQPFAPQLVCPDAPIAISALRLYSLRGVFDQEMVGGTVPFGSSRGRAPPRVNQA